MKCLCNIDYSQIDSYVTVFIATIALFQTHKMNILKIIQSQIALKAQEINGVLGEKPNALPEKQAGLSTILTPINTTVQLLTIQINGKWYFKFN